MDLKQAIQNLEDEGFRVELGTFERLAGHVRLGRLRLRWVSIGEDWETWADDIDQLAGLAEAWLMEMSFEGKSVFATLVDRSQYGKIQFTDEAWEEFRASLKLHGQDYTP